MSFVCRFRYEHLFYNNNEKAKTALNADDGSNIDDKRVEFLVHTHREALK